MHRLIDQLGGAVSIYLCSKYQDKVKALIIENTFISIEAMIELVMPLISPLKFLATNKWKSLETISSIKIPILLLAGKKDELVPFSHMKLLQEAVSKNNSNVYFHSFEDGHHVICYFFISCLDGYLDKTRILQCCSSIFTNYWSLLSYVLLYNGWNVLRLDQVFVWKRLKKILQLGEGFQLRRIPFLFQSRIFLEMLFEYSHLPNKFPKDLNWIAEPCAKESLLLEDWLEELLLEVGTVFKWRKAGEARMINVMNLLINSSLIDSVKGSSSFSIIYFFKITCLFTTWKKKNLVREWSILGIMDSTKSRTGNTNPHSIINTIISMILFFISI